MRPRNLVPHLRKLERRSFGAIAAALVAVGCGTAEHALVAPDAGNGDAGAQVTSGVNVCPHFDSSLILPPQVGPLEDALVAVQASDPDASDTELVFAWSAPSGSFSARDKPVTNYRCSQLGREQLTVTAVDRPGCRISMTIAVDCVAN